VLPDETVQLVNAVAHRVHDAHIRVGENGVGAAAAPKESTMTKAQLEMIAGMIAGVEFALVHVCKTLHANGLTPDFAPSFLATAEALPADVRNRDQIAMVLRHIAGGIQNAESAGGLGDEIKKVLN
jgi:hypothetical protein